MHFARDTYSYVWPRDGALVAHALDMAGYPEKTRKFFHFCADVITRDGYLLHKYNPDKSLASSWHPWIGGHPSATGTQADVQLGRHQLPIQEDETALVVWAMWRHFQRYRDIDAMKPLYGRSSAAPPTSWSAIASRTRSLPAPSYDLWEERRGILTFTCAAVYGGLVAAAEFAHAFGDDRPCRALRPRGARDPRRHGSPPVAARARSLRAHGQRLRRNGADVTVDAHHRCVAFGASRSAPTRPTIARVVATMKAVRERLWCKTEVGGVARYEGDYYHAVSQDTANVPGNPWFICTMWLALHAVHKARTVEELQEAVEILEWVDARKLPSGVLAEQVHPFTNAPMSVSPLTWSHATVVDVVQ